MCFEGRERDEQTERIRCLEQANEAKKKKIQDLHRCMSELEEKTNRLKEKLQEDKETPNCAECEHEPGGYVFCMDLSSGAHAKRGLVEEAFRHIVRAILYRYPDTHVGVIVEHQDIVIERIIGKVDADTEHAIRRCTSNSTRVIDLSITLKQALSMLSTFRSGVPKGPCRIILIGYDQIESAYPERTVETIQSAEVEIHNLIVGKGAAAQKDCQTWRIANETGGRNIFYL